MGYTDEELLAGVRPRKDAQISVEQDTSAKMDDPFVERKGYPVSSASAQSNPDSVGTLITGQEQLRITDEDANIVAYIRSSLRENIKIGSYYLIPYPNGETMFTRVKELEYMQKYPTDDASEIHSERAENMNLDEDEFILCAHLEAICILSKNEKGVLLRRTVDKIPKPDTIIRYAHDLESIQTGLNIPNEGIFLGYLSVGGELVKTDIYPYNVAYYLQDGDSSREPLIFRHVLTCGSTGTGKTYITKNIHRQFIDPNVRYKSRDPNVSGEFQPCLISLDPQDEYSQICADNPNLGADHKNQFDTEGIKHGGVRNTKTFAARVGNEMYYPTTSAPTKDFTIPFELVEYNHWLIHGSEMNENQIYGLERLLGDYFYFSKANLTHIPTYNDFINYITNPSVKEEYTEINKTIHEATYESIVRKVENIHFRKTFDQGGDNILDIFDQVFVPGQVSVFPTEHISSSRSRDLIILTLMSLIVDNKLKNTGDKRIKNIPLILSLDEAHRYLSSAKSTQARAIVGKFTEAARQGRKESLGLMLITQDPQDIAGSIMKQINTKIILNLNNESAISSLQIPKKYEKRIPFLKRGQMIVHSPDNSDTVELIGLDNCTVNHV